MQPSSAPGPAAGDGVLVDGGAPTWRQHKGAEREDAFHGCMRRFYFPFLVRFQREVLLAWLVVFALSAAFGPKFFSLTKSDFSQPPGTPSYDASRALLALYPNFPSFPPAFVVYTATAGTPGGILGGAAPASKAASTRLAAWAARKYADTVNPPMGYWELSAGGPELAVLAGTTLSSDNTTMRATIGFLPNATIERINAFAKDLLHYAPELSSGPVTAAATGLFPLFAEMQEATEASFALIDAVVLPLGVLILGYYVRSYRHMGLALLALAASLLLAFAVLVPVTDTVNINPFAPSIMLSLGIAVCFDYTLFLVTRFKEERLVAGLCREDAVFSMLITSGHVVLLSGSTLTLTFFLLLFFPQNFLNSIGISCSGVVIASMLCTLTVIPCLMLYLDCMSFFDLYPRSTANCCCRVPKVDPVELYRAEAAAAAAAAAAAPAAAAGGSKGTAALRLQWPAPPSGAQGDASSASASASSADASSAAASSAAASSSSAATSSAAASSSSSSSSAPPLALPLGDKDSAPPLELHPRTSWFYLSWFLSGPIARYVVLAGVAGITVPFFMAFLALKPSSDDYLIYLQDSSSLKALQQMQAVFPLGSLDPYSVLLDTGLPRGSAAAPNGGVFTPAYWDAEAAIVARVLATQSAPGFVGPASVTGLSYFDGAPVSFEQATGGYLNASSPLYATRRAVAYRASTLGGLSASGGANLLTIVTLVNPNSQGVIPFVVGVRGVLGEVQARVRREAGAAAAGAVAPAPATLPPLPALTLYLVGGYSATMDIQDALYALVPVQIIVVTVMVLIIVGVSYGSVVLILRLLYTIFVSLAWTYGLMVLVYQPGPAQDAFAVLTPSIRASVGLYWIIPILAFSVLVGLALDFDVFLISRVVEFRKLGWSDRASVCLAIEKTGGIISVAGLIMVVSFAGLLIPKTIVLNQYGFSLFIGVALDTFVMRPILVPAIISAFGEGYNWWPSKMPPRVFADDAEEHRALLAGHDVPPAPAAAESSAPAALL